MKPTPAEDLAREIWPDATPEQLRQLSGALLRAFQKLKTAPDKACETFFNYLQKNP